MSRRSNHPPDGAAAQSCAWAWRLRGDACEGDAMSMWSMQSIKSMAPMMDLMDHMDFMDEAG